MDGDAGAIDSCSQDVWVIPFVLPLSMGTETDGTQETAPTTPEPGVSRLWEAVHPEAQGRSVLLTGMQTEGVAVGQRTEGGRR